MNPAEIRAYQSLRQTGKEFHGKLMKVIPKEILVSTAQELGLWKGGVLVAEENETDILAERLIYDKRWDGKRTLEHFAERNTAISPTQREAVIMSYLREKEFGYRKRRLDLPENYSLYFLRLHRRFGIDVRYGADEEE